MNIRTKSALVVFIGLAMAFTVVMVFDYTDSYVGDRFRRAVQAYPPDSNASFSLDAFMEFYDWDSVCLVPNGSNQTFLTHTGGKYAHKAVSGQVWSLVFLKKAYVVAEIPLERAFLAYPNHLEQHCFERWNAIFRIVRDNNNLRLEYSGG